ncbi:hypothetical protein BDW74DRAFT_180786 [Aspergillus multicolor]|uniref:uncharacterized protein n=1 Tax=Aspergillus multicolor TaxID=41759 RepID=UPI003CCD75DB
MNSRKIPTTNDRASSALDFVTAATVISRMYLRGNYLKFQDVDGNPKERELSLLGKGSVFVAYKREIIQKVPSPLQMGQYDTRSTPVVFKQPKTIFDAAGQPLLPEDLRGFLMETQVLSHRPLYWHPNVITPIGISWSLDLFCRAPAVQPQLVLEVADQSLDKFLDSSPNNPFQARVRIALDITNGLRAVHACGIIHGDIKPANVLLCNDTTRPGGTFTAKIADFSHSWIFDHLPSRHLVGSQNYRAPEVIRREMIADYRPADTYSLGVTLWRVLVINSDIPIALPLSYSIEPDSQDDPYLESVLTCLRHFLDRDANERRWPLLRRVASASLSLDPTSRQTTQIQDALVSFLQSGSDALDREELDVVMGTVNSITMAPLQETQPDSLFVNLQLFQCARGPVQDQLMEALQQICQTSWDVRRPEALYTLGICKLAGFGDPQKANAEVGLMLLHDAADQGHVGAKGYLPRVLRTFARGVNGHRILLPELLIPSNWLLDAAVAGHEVAFDEITEGGTNKRTKGQVLRLRALARFQSDLTIDRLFRFQNAVGKISESQMAERFVVNDNGDTILHWASYRNLYPHLHYLLEEGTPLDVDVPNADGDTALITACSVGNLEAALCLIRAGADVNMVNKQSETCLHYLWRFTDDEGSQLLHELAPRGINYDTESLHPSLLLDSAESAGPMVSELDPLPVLAGKAVLRLAGRGRTTLLRELLLAAPPSEPRDGNLVRQMIRWASTLTFPDMRDMLVAFARGDDFTSGSQGNSVWDFVPIEDTTFESESATRGYLDAVAQGYLSFGRGGWKTPDIWWRICCHGPTWWERLQLTMNSIIWGSSKSLCCYESTVLRSLEIHSLSFFRLFFQSMTDNRLDQRIRSRPHAVCICNKAKVKNFNPSSRGQREIRLRPMKRPVDRVMYKDGRTMLHLTIMMGLRQAFLILVDEFHADIERLVKCQSSADYPPHGLNCYSLLAMYSKDWWFIDEFANRGLQPGYSGQLQSMFSWKVFLPFYGLWSTSYYLFIPPLLHAFDHGCHFLVRFLLDQGYTLQQPITVRMTVLDYVLAPAIINTATLRFLFGRRGQYLTETGDLKLIDSSLIPRRLFDQGKGLRIFQLVAQKQQLTLDDPDSMAELPKRARFSLHPPSTWTNYLQNFILSIIFSAYSIPMNVIYLPMTYMDLSNESVRKRAEERIITTKDPVWLGRHLSTSKEAEQDQAILVAVWQELLRLFPNVKVTPIWYRVGFGFHRSRSLLATAVLGSQSIDLWGPYSLSTATVSHFATWSKDKDTDPLAQMTMDYYVNAVTQHEPSLTDFFLFDDYDLVPSGTIIGKRLYEMGHRHSLLYFYDVRAALILVVWLTPFAVIVGLWLFHARAPASICGILLLYPSLLLSCFEKPYARFLMVNITIMVGWPFLYAWPWNAIQKMTLFFLIAASIFLSPFLLIVYISAMGTRGLLYPKERYLCNALIRQVEYTGYSPLRLFRTLSPEKEPGCELEARRRVDV